MTSVFHDGLEALKERVAAAGILGEWSEEAGGKHIFRSRERGVMSYWPSTGTIQYQGKPEAEAALKSALDETNTTLAGTIPTTKDNRTKIFIVHGHDKKALDQLELILLRLDLKPYILQNNANGSNTIIEALEQQIHREAAFGIVLMTPDDFGYAKSEGKDEAKPRARQNVILELGMVLASLGRERMALLKKGILETPSDFDGVLRLDFNDNVKEVAVKLAKGMKAAGIKIDDAMIALCGE